MAISANDYFKQFNKKSFRTLTAQEQLNYQKQKEKEAKNKLNDYMKKNNISFNGRNTAEYVDTKVTSENLNKKARSDSWNEALNPSLQLQNKFKENIGKLPTASNPNIKETYENALKNTPKYQEFYRSNAYKNYTNEYYKTPLYQYNADLEKVNNQKDFSFGEKALTSFTAGLRNAINSDRQYRMKDSNGKTVYVNLPNYQQLKSQKIMEKSNTLGKIYQQATQSIGQMVPSIVAGAVTGGLGLGTSVGSLSVMGLNAYGSSKNQALLDGYTEEQAKKYGIMNAGVELVTEKMFDGLGGLFGKGSLDKLVTEKLTKNISNQVTKTLAVAGINSLGEGIEEVASDIAQPLIKQLALGSKEDYITLLKDENVAEDFFAGVLSSAIMSSPQTIGNLNTSYKLNALNNQNNINNTVQNNNTIQNGLNTQNDSLVSKTNIIDEKVNEYINSVKNNFVESAKIDTNIVQSENEIPINYKMASESTIYSKAKSLFSKIGKKVFNNNSEKIFVTNNDIKESIDKTIKNPEQKELINENLAVFSQLDKIIENAREIAYSEKDSKSRPFKDYKYYVSNALIDGNQYVVEFDTRVDSKSGKDERHFRLERVYPIQKEASATGQVKLPVDRFGTETSLYNNNSTTNRQSQIAPLPINSNMQQNQNNTQQNIPSYKNINNVKMLPIENSQTTNSKILNPNEISQLTKEDANTTPKLPVRNRNQSNDGESRFYENIRDKTNMLTDEQKEKILDSDEVKYYDKVTNKESLNKAFEKLSKNGQNESLKWFNKDSKEADSVDVAEGYILLKQYADNNDYDSMVEVAKKMRDIGTKAGQTVQAFNIMERLTPEGMVKYAQSELQEAWEKMRINKTEDWIDKYRKDFDLTPSDVQFIMNNMKEVSTMEDGYDKKVKLAEIQKLMTDKLPPEKGAGIKSWMRISMLFNPKTQVRNVVGNAIIMPVNSFSDLFASYVDKIVAKKTGVRTTGKTNVKAMLKGMREGAYQATNDYKKGINTRDIEGNRFEISESKSFDNQTLMGKSLNRVESMLNYAMDAGDRVFSQAAFENSLQNQLVLNNTNKITSEMLDIARAESLQRTWNDNNNYTKFVLGVRRFLNIAHIGKYGVGDVLIPFAKTPANLTKAIVDYSPAGLVNTLVEGNNLRKSLTNGQFTASMQHKFVQDLGKATAGTMLYVLGYALAKSGTISGESDDDKDVSNFLKNTLGVSSYSIKIGNKSFTYDWAQPIAAPLSIMANVVNAKNNKNQALLEGITSSLDTAGSILLEQSFLQSINDVLSDNDGVVSGLINEMLELPARAVPTFSKQIADMVDGTQRTSFEYGKPIKSAVNSLKAKIPFISKTLAPTVDTMGREVKKYGGKNNLFNVFLNPANVNTENISEGANEIYKVYKATGDKSIMPRVPEYKYKDSEGNLLKFGSKERSEYQKISGNIVENTMKDLLNNSKYTNLSNEDKASIINNVVNYSYNKAREEVLGISMSNTYNNINKYVSNGGKVADYYTKKEEIDYSLKNPEKYAVISNITSYDKYQEYQKELSDIRNNTKDDKNETIKYINSLKLSIPQKAMFIKQYYPSFNEYNKEIIEYINGKKLKSNEKETILTKLGFTVRNGKVYY